MRRIADAGGLEAVVSGQFTHTFVEFVKYRYSLLLIVVVQFTVHHTTTSGIATTTEPIGKPRSAVAYTFHRGSCIQVLEGWRRG